MYDTRSLRRPTRWMIPWLALGLAACSPPRVALVGGRVLTVDADDRVVSAIGLAGDRVAIVGSDAEVLAWAGGSARIVRLEGRGVVPGFIDAHGHFPGEGLDAVAANLRPPPAGEVASIDEALARLRVRAADTKPGRWVMGIAFDDTGVREKRFLLRRDLDAVSTEHPIAVLHISGHLASANGAALAALGIERGTADPPGGRIRRDAGGEPDGVLEERAIEGLQKIVMQPGPLDALRIAQRASEIALSRGVTTAQNGYAAPAHLSAMAWASRLGIVPLRLVLWPGEETALGLEDGSLSRGHLDPEWTPVGAYKLVADGSIQGYTAHLAQPYHVPQGHDPNARGYPTLEPARLNELVGRWHAAGRQIAIHGNGDAAIDAILDAIDAAQRAVPRPDARHVIVHAQTARDDQLDRMQALGVIPSFFVLHVFYWGDRHRDVFLGPERAARISPTASAARRGIRFTLHADAPVVPLEPLRILEAAVTRRTASGAELGPSERVDVRRALRAITLDAAHQHFEDAVKGSLEPGKLADLVVLDRAPDAVAPEDLAEIRVLATVIGGRTAWRADATAPAP